MDRFDFLEPYSVDFSLQPASMGDIHGAEQVLGFQFGPELTYYLWKYGYLGFGSTEFYGMNRKQKLQSDLVKITLRLRERHPVLQGFAVFESCGDGVYVLVDGMDRMFRYVAGDPFAVSLDRTLTGYIRWRIDVEQEF